MFGRVCAIPLTLGMLLGTGLSGGAGLAPADPGSDIAALVAAVAEANQKLQDLGAAVQSQQESVNKAIVDVQTARDAAAAAQRELNTSLVGVKDANAAIAAAKKRFDTFAAATYVSGPSGSYLTAADPADIIEESAARLARQNADKAAADAQASQDAAVSALTSAQQTFGSQQAELDRLTAERRDAQAKLDAARTWSAPAAGQPRAAAQAAAPAAGGDRWDPGAPASAAPPPDTKQWDTPWDPTLPAIPSAFVSGDPIAIINTVLGISATSAQVTADLGRNFLTSIGILKPSDTGINTGRIPRVYGRQASEYVIRRAGSQMGVPYSWGGGNAAGPSRGIDRGANTVGFDCSGLILYAFAGVGIKLPHYSGSQYKMGRQIPSSQMRRGDVIFYGPGGSQHVTLYLGNGQMLEAPYTGSHVKISPVRTSGMTPYVVRYIEY